MSERNAPASERAPEHAPEHAGDTPQPATETPQPATEASPAGGATLPAGTDGVAAPVQPAGENHNGVDAGDVQGQAEASDADLRRQMAQVIQEYLRLDKQLQMVENTNFRVCIFGSARIRRRDPTWQQVYMLSKRLAKMGIDIVTGGGPGLMEAASRAVQDAHDERSKTYGLPLDIPSLVEPANRHLDIKSAHQRFSTRLDEFMRLSHAVVVAPGGIGTLLELSYVWQLIQIGLIDKRPVILFGGDFWKGLLDWMRDCMAERGFINPSDLDDVQLVSTRDEVIEILAREQEKFLQELEETRAGHVAPPVSVTVGQPTVPVGVIPGAPAPQPGAPVPTAAGLVMTAHPDAEPDADRPDGPADD